MSERARTGGLDAALARIVPALEAFLRLTPGPDPARARSRWRPLLDHPLPQQGVGADAVLAELADVVIPNGLRVGAPGFSGWVTTMPTTVPAVASLAGALVAAQKWWVHPANLLEVLAVRWLVQLLGLPDGFGGIFTSGGAMANLLGLGAARQHAGERLGVNPAADGAAVLPRPRVYAPASVHRVVLRACSVLGLGQRALRRVPTDPRRGPDLDLLRRAIDEDLAAGCTPVAVVASAGDVNLGMVEPLDAMSRIARERGLWFHVDGAYGAFGVLDERVRPLYGDIGQIDSLTVDPHKWMATPVGCGAVLVRDPAVLDRAFEIEQADYARYQPATDVDPASPFEELGQGFPDRTFEHGAPARGLVVWALLREIGAQGMRERVTRHLDCARRVADRARASDHLELLAEPVLSICCFRYRPPQVRDAGALDRLNEAIVCRLRARGRVSPSTTLVDDKLAIRPCFIGPRATLADADALVDEVLAAGHDLASSGPP